MSETSVLLKHYRLLARNIASFSDGQARLKTDDGTKTDGEEASSEDSLTSVCVTLSPCSGPYRGGEFDFEIDISGGYPTSPPVVRCQTNIYHPNIDTCEAGDGEGDVCLNLLDELWEADMSLEDVVQGLLFLMHHPNLDDPLSSMFNGSEDEEEFVNNVRRSLRGEEVDGIEFERNLVDDYESEEEDQKGTREVDPVIEEANEPVVKPPGSSDTKTMETQTSNTEILKEDEDTQIPTCGPFSSVIIPSPPLSPSQPSPVNMIPIESSVDREDYIIPFTPPAQPKTLFGGLSKMWGPILNNLVRTVALLPSTNFQRQTSSSVDVRW